MTIDQLPATMTDNVTDEVPVCQGTSTMKTTWNKIIQLIRSAFNGTATPLPSAETAAVGTSIRFSHEDHVHPLPSGLQGIHFLTAQISSNGSIDVNISGTSAGVFWISGQALNRMGYGIWSSVSSGATLTSLTPVAGTNLTVTDGTGKFTLSNANSVLVRVLLICFNGSAPTIS